MMLLMLFGIILLLDSSANADVFSDDFSTDTTGGYTVTNTWTQGGTGSFVYDSTGQRAMMLTGDDISLKISKSLPLSDTGAFSIDFLPTQIYPLGGTFYIRLIQDQNNYYELKNTDGYGPKEFTKHISGSVVDSASFVSEYAQNNNYTITITFSPSQTTVSAFGENLVINTDSSGITVNSFEVEITQQDAYFDNIFYKDNIVADTTAPAWDSVAGIGSATDTQAGGSVTIEFGSATDDVDGSNVRYNVYYAQSGSWDNSDWSNNSVLLNVTPTAGATYANAYTVGGLTNGSAYTFGVRVADQSGNEDANTNMAIATPTGAAGNTFSDDFSTDTTGGYTVTNTWTQSGTGSFVYDSTGQRARMLTGDNIGLMISKSLPSSDTGAFSIDFLPTQKYPYGGTFYIRLIQDQNNYYELKNTDGYGPKEFTKHVSGSVADTASFTYEYAQNNNYTITITFSPSQTTVSAFGENLVINTDSSGITVNSFEVEITQQDAYFDNIYYDSNSISVGPSIITQPTNQSVTEGQTAMFSVGASGTPPLSYQWRENSVDIAGATGSSYTTPATSLADNGKTFDCVVTNSVDSVISNAATLTVTATAVGPSIITQPTSQSVTEGQTAMFSVGASGTPPLSYQWRENSVDIAGATGSSYTTPATLLADNGKTFDCVVTNSVDSVISNAATLTVTESGGGGEAFSDDFSTDTTGGYTVTNTWTQGGTGSFVYDSTGQRAMMITGDDISLKISKSLPLSDTGAFSIDFLPTQKYPLGGTFYIRLIQDQNNYYELKNTDGYGPKEFTKHVSGSVADTASFTYEYAQNNNYTITITFSPSQTTVSAFGENLVINTDSSGITVNSFEVEITQQDAYFDNIYYDSNSISVGPSIITQPTNQSVTEGQTAMFSVGASGTPPLSYQWRENSVDIAGATGSSYTTPATSLADNGKTFDCVVTNSVDSVISNAATLTVTATAVGPSIITQPTNQSVTEGQTAMFSVGASGTPPLSYQWRENSVDIAGATGSSYTTPATSLADNGKTFDCVVTNSVDSVISNAATLTVTESGGGGEAFSDDFSTDTTGGYTVTNTWTQGGTGSFVYDSTGQRAMMLTGDDISLKISKSLPLSDTGAFSIDFLPTQKYPLGGTFYIRLIQDQNNYYELKNTDGYGPKEFTKHVSGSVADTASFTSEYAQNNNYTITITFSPSQTTVSAFGENLVINTDSSGITVNSFEVEITQQDAYFDNIFYRDNIVADTTAPAWDSVAGIGSATDTQAGGSVTIEFGSATDDVDGSNVRYNVYYAQSGSWDNSDWSNNSVLLNVTPTAGATYANAYTVGGLTNGSAYTFGVRVADQSGNEDANTNMAIATPTGAAGNTFSDDFSTDTTGGYTVTNTWTQSGTGSFVYDSTGQRARMLTGDNIGLMISKSLPSSDTGAFSIDFLPTQKYPYGGTFYIRLIQDQNNYYELKNTDGYGPGEFTKHISGSVVDSASFASEYAQNNNYTITITFSPSQTTVSAFGQNLVINTDSSGITVNSFEVEITQQDAYFDNIFYRDNIVADTTAPAWDSVAGIGSATDTQAGGSVTIEFGSATDDVDGSNVRYNVYYAQSGSWDNSDWSNNSVLLNVTPTAGATYANAYTVGGLFNGSAYTFGVRVADQSGNEDANTNTAIATPTGATGNAFSDDFNDGNADGWDFITNSKGRIGVWQVINGEYNQINDVKGFDQSYHLGTYSYYTNGFSLNNYQVSVKVIPVINADQPNRDTVGIMFRYIDDDNYYRFSMSAVQGFARLEKKVNGVFSTLLYNNRGFDASQDQNVIIDLDGSKILIYVNGDPLFSCVDSSLPNGTIALYAMNQAKFDDVIVTENDDSPKVIISKPTAFSVAVTDSESISYLRVIAVARNIPQGPPVGGIEFLLDSTTSSGLLQTETNGTYTFDFPGVGTGDHIVEAIIEDGFGTPVAGSMTQDFNEYIGFYGKQVVAIGDSISLGAYDDIFSDDSSQYGRNISGGFTPILTDSLTDHLQQPTIVINEGLGGTFSNEGASRLSSTRARYPNAQYWLILFGTNDALATAFTPSGVDCVQGNPSYPSCTGTFKGYIRQMVIELQDAGKIPLLAKVPYSSVADTDEDQRIQDYNTVIDQLRNDLGIQVVAPDLYTHFYLNPTELTADGVHPNGQGYVSIADFWFDVLTDNQNGIF